MFGEWDWISTVRISGAPSLSEPPGLILPGVLQPRRPYPLPLGGARLAAFFLLWMPGLVLGSAQQALLEGHRSGGAHVDHPEAAFSQGLALLTIPALLVSKPWTRKWNKGSRMEGQRGRKGVNKQNKVTHLLLLSTLLICDATSPKVSSLH